MSGRQVLELMGWQPHTARNQALRFRAHNIELLEQMAPHLGDEQKLIALAKQGRQQLETMWAQERAEQADRRNRQGWQAGDESGPPPCADCGISTGPKRRSTRGGGPLQWPGGPLR